MQRQSLNRERIDWPQLRREVIARARGARVPADTYPAIAFALSRLGDNHSAFLPPEQLALRQRRAPDAPQPEGRRLDGGINLVRIPDFLSYGDQETNDRFAAGIVEVIASVDHRSACGWVVDLRFNRGGNGWPMLAGVGPILGDGHIGATAYPDGRQERWFYQNGRATLEGQVMATGPAYRLNHPAPPVAVLTDRYTASSAEGVAIAFRERPDTRSFGEPTAGVPTVNEVMIMPDGAWLAVTTGRMADRTARAYDAPLVPDEPVEGFWTFAPESDDRALQAAIAWLRTQHQCVSGR